MIRTIRLLCMVVFLSAVIQGCQPAPVTETITTTTSSPTSTTPAESIIKPVVLISWDAARVDTINELMTAGFLPTFKSMVENGIQAEYAQTVDPPLTAAAHNSISSGSYPTHTGITSNSFHVTGDDFYWYRKGFEEPMDDAEPIWVTASRSGLKTASVFFPGGTPALSGQMADYTIGYGIEDAYSKQWEVALSSAQGWSDAPESFSNPQTGSITIQNVGPVYLYVIDSIDDNMQNYDTVILNTERSGSKPAQVLRVAEWGSLVMLERAYAGADFLIQDITSERVTLYQTGVERNTASPKELLTALNENFGYFPAGGDYYALENGWITEEDFLFQLKKQSTYMAEVAAWVFSTYQPDLMFTWQDPFDSAGHQFFMSDPRQLSYSPEAAENYQGYYQRAAKVADHSLSIMLEAIDLGKTTVLMVGDHGMAPIHTSVFVNTILEQAGLLTLDNQNYVVVNESKAFSIASGGSAHIYINLVGREKEGGIVTAAEYPAVVDQIFALLTQLVDPITGDPVFQRVLTRDQLESLGLDHPNSGDIFVQAIPGYALDGWRGNDFIFGPVDYYGQHGYDSSLPEMHAIFIAAGAGIHSTGEVIPPVKVVDFAPTIALLLSFQPVPTVDGSPIPYFLKP